MYCLKWVLQSKLTRLERPVHPLLPRIKTHTGSEPKCCNISLSDNVYVDNLYTPDPVDVCWLTFFMVAQIKANNLVCLFASIAAALWLCQLI